jgi:predicted dinucleotide-binding enzyme
MNCEVMVDPGRVSGDHDVFVCGDDDGAKTQVSELLQSFGWPAGSIVDLGELSAARGTEAYVLLWVRLYGAFGTGDLNIKVVR